MGARSFIAVLGASSVLAACAASSSSDRPEEPVSSDESGVRVDTRSPEARRQYDANVSFAINYRARCGPSAKGRRRVLLTGFGRFMDIANNASGRIVSTLVPDARYPETLPPPVGEVDRPGPQLSVGMTTLDLPGVGLVDVCGMVLPVSWDLAAILIAKEAQAFRPELVVMNGVGESRQPLWIELGATNRAALLEDGSSVLRPALGWREKYAKLVQSAPQAEYLRGNLLSWRAVETAAEDSVAEQADDVESGTPFGDVVWGVKLAGFPRPSNRYLCNNVTYVIGWLMGHPRYEIRLLLADPPRAGAINSVPISIDTDLTKVPRVFLHWPSDLAEVHAAAAANVMKAIVAAQLAALTDGPRPTVGDNALADPTADAPTSL